MARMLEGKHVVVHCRGGMGRAGTVAACLVVDLHDRDSAEAIAWVRRTRGPGAIESRAQEEYVRKWWEFRRTSAARLLRQPSDPGPAVDPAIRNPSESQPLEEQTEELSRRREDENL